MTDDEGAIRDLAATWMAATRAGFVRDAFDMNQESPETLTRYGKGLGKYAYIAVGNEGIYDWDPRPVVMAQPCASRAAAPKKAYGANVSVTPYMRRKNPPHSVSRPAPQA